MSPLNSTEHGDPHRARTKLGSFAIGLIHGMGGSAGVGILLVASIESQLLGVISLGALAIFTGRSMTILSRAFGAALASRPLRSSLTAWRLVSESRASRSRSGTELPPGPLAPYPF
ncbi:MAG TPA: hypothetical protein VF225_07670 [Gaiellaceae bacterium]